MNLFHDYVRYETRRQFFRHGGNVLARGPESLLGQDKSSANDQLRPRGRTSPPRQASHLPANVGGPAQMDLYD